MLSQWVQCNYWEAFVKLGNKLLDISEFSQDWQLSTFFTFIMSNIFISVGFPKKHISVENKNKKALNKQNHKKALISDITDIL